MDSMPTLASVASMRKRRNKSLPGPHGCGCGARVGRRGTKNSVKPIAAILAPTMRRGVS
jgi:hypothetical protein